jgi:hypothetical protein
MSAFHKPVEHRRAGEHIDIIVGTGHAKERVSNPQIMQCHYLKNNSAFLGMAVVPILPSKLIVLSLPMHAIDATDHVRELSSLIDRQQLSSFLNS